MERKYNIIIFDLDGTLVNSLDDIYTAVNYSLTKYNYPIRTIEEIRNFVGNGIRNLIERSVPDGLLVEEVNKVYEVFKIYYEEHATDKTYPYEGIIELLNELKLNGYHIGISTNKVQSAVDLVYEKFFSSVCDIALGDTPGRERKPSPDSVNEIVKFYGGKMEETLYVGDSEVDIHTADNAGVDIVSVTWGFRDRETLEKAGAIKVADTVEELANVIGIKWFEKN